MKRLTKTYCDGSHGALNDTEYGGENSYSYKNAIIDRLGKYEDLGYEPEELKAFLNTYSINKIEMEDRVVEKGCASISPMTGKEIGKVMKNCVGVIRNRE